MALSALTPRDRLQHLVDLGRKAVQHWWIVVALAVAGAALALVFAMNRPKKYQSWSTIFYQERIQSSLLSPGREEVALRNIGDKYRELLLTRTQLRKIIADPALNPFPDAADPELAIDELRQLVKLEARGGNAFRVVFTDTDPDRARLVTEKLTTQLRELDESLRLQQARATVEFAQKQKEEAEVELRKRRGELTEFLSAHPEFASDATGMQAEGASIRARQQGATGGKLTPEDQRLLTLERQRARIQALLAAPAGAPLPPAPPAPPSPERTSALLALRQAETELAAADRNLQLARTRYGPKHPTVLQAEEVFQVAEQRVAQARAAVPSDAATTPVVPTTPQDRKKLERQLAEVDAQIAKAQSAKPGTPPTDATSWIVQLEGQYAELRRRMVEQSERTSALADAVFRTTMDANQKAAETGGRLEVIDPAFTPVKPSGPGKKIFLMAGVVLFSGLGLAIAAILAVLDDRLYRRRDLADLGMPVLAVIPRDPQERPRQVRRQVRREAAALAREPRAQAARRPATRHGSERGAA